MKALFTPIFTPRTKEQAEREGRSWRLTGLTREWIVAECNDTRKADILRGWDASEKAGEVIP